MDIDPINRVRKVLRDWNVVEYIAWRRENDISENWVTLNDCEKGPLMFRRDSWIGSWPCDKIWLIGAFKNLDAAITPIIDFG